MNAKVDQAEQDMITIEVDGVEVKARKGAMLIEATDSVGVDVPRFCYHKKLSIAANCRMCLVELEQGGRPAPKPMPACSTPVADGMKVMTKSPKAVAAQRGVMEFLLINHPLDCPICDQGGECELQDLAMGYGRGVSRFTEGKRVVDDEDLGPLVATEMTRCIHCTRCVRFLDEVAGLRELGGIGRGELTKISTYVEAGVQSEMSGNIIDLCPVGALTSKPYRYRARAWEMLSHPGVSPHDPIGTNVALHHLRGEVKRVVPRENESINECWIADRDRYSYTGIRSADRLEQPMIKRDGQWQETEWEDALGVLAEGLKQHAASLGSLVSPAATVEEMTLLGKLMRDLGSRDIDHRLGQADFRDDAQAPLMPALPGGMDAVETAANVLLVGCDPRVEAPMLNHRLRKASLAGGRVGYVNPLPVDPNFDGARQWVDAPQRQVAQVAAVVAALLEQRGASVPDGVKALAGELDEQGKALVAHLNKDGDTLVISGALTDAHPDGALLRALCGELAKADNVAYGHLTAGANSAGAWLAGCVPHRELGGSAAVQTGRNARQMIEAGLDAYLLFNVEPELDCWDGAAARAAMDKAGFVAVFSPYLSEAMKAYADVILPIAAYSETSGSFVNAEGRVQSFPGIAKPVGEARPAWRVLRVLGNMLQLDGYDYQSSEEILAEFGEAVPEELETAQRGYGLGDYKAEWKADGAVRVGQLPLYRVDALCRRAEPLQQTAWAGRPEAVLATDLAEKLGAADGDKVNVAGVALPARVNADLPKGCVAVPAAFEQTAGVGPRVGAVDVSRV